MHTIDLVRATLGGIIRNEAQFTVRKQDHLSFTSTYIQPLALLDDGVIIRPASLKSRSPTAADPGAPNNSGYRGQEDIRALSSLSPVEHTLEGQVVRWYAGLQHFSVFSSARGFCSNVGGAVPPSAASHLPCALKVRGWHTSLQSPSPY